MVQWQGEIDRKSSGLKAARLDSINSLEVPNFFTVTRKEVEKITGKADKPEDYEIPSDLRKEIKNAHSEIGMSSEVRNASGRARNLVGGQRDSQRVSIRISSKEKGLYSYKLNVGRSDLEKALKEVIASYYKNKRKGTPAILIQKMMEPGETGTAIHNFTDSQSLIETVKGLGNSLEQGITTPELYLLNREKVKEKRIPEKQVKVTRNPMNGQKRRRKIGRDGASFSDAEATNFIKKVENEGLSVKFVHKRGTFYIVDAFKNQVESQQETLEGLRVSKGEIKGTTGRQITLSDQTAAPEEYREALIARKGGFVSSHAQRARAENKPAVFSFKGEIQEGEEIKIPAGSVRVQEKTEESRQKQVQQVEGLVTATEILPLSSDEVNISDPFSNHRIKGEEFETREILQSCREILGFNSDKYVIDARNLEKQPLLNTLDYLEAERKILILESPDRETIAKAIEKEVETIITPSKGLENVKKLVAREEKRKILGSVCGN